MMGKINSKNQRLTTSIISAFAALLLVNNASAITMSTEEFTEYAPEEAYWVVNVDCEDSSAPRVIQRKTDGNQWCGKEIEGFCFDDKQKAADTVCGNEYSLQLVEVQRIANEQAQAEKERAEAERLRRQQAEQKRLAEEAKRQKLIKIDEELLSLEQEELSLRRQELELQRRAVEIREELEALDAQ